MFSFLFIALAAIGNALMDVLDERFDFFIFKNKDKNFWSKNVSYKTAKKIFGYKLDAWHITKTLVIILFCIAILTYSPFTGLPLIDLLIMGIVWNLTFNSFYNRVWQKK